ncbi:GNAT family N-acetyltransferase [Microvirga pudoricolor]|uniref:GNAT family N-acetyltransferase n=1 Tax=Microvirga pudoricolor TaxID=2778729 RepID=UPI0019518BFA|nr:GNAT family N-acetyltransferase [Microvirga pudoricolor]MBM6594654.1 GNAT family N-acetyltransferase [Microvirga pudoricolor]
MIRLATLEDEVAVRDCARNAYERYVPAIGHKPAPMTADYAAQIGTGEVHVATDRADVLLGFIVFHARDGDMLLENVAVQPWASGRGIGGGLIRFCEQEALRLGCRAVRLYTNEKMTDNLALYPRLGYVEVDRRAEDGFNRVFFEKRLG